MGLQWTPLQVVVYKDIVAGTSWAELHAKYSGSVLAKVLKALKAGEAPDAVKGSGPPAGGSGPAAQVPTPAGDGQKPAAVKKLPQAGSLAEAVRYRFVPKEFTIDASPIIFLAMEAAVNLWGWPPTMRPGDFVDTVLYRYCKEHGVTLLEYAQEGQKEGGNGSPQ